MYCFQDYIQNKSLVFSLPYQVRTINIFPAYTLFDFATELGGWIGMLFGYCVLDTVDFLIAGMEIYEL